MLVRVQRELQRLRGDRGWLNVHGCAALGRRIGRFRHLEVRHNLLALAGQGRDNLDDRRRLGTREHHQRLPKPLMDVPEHARLCDLVSIAESRFGLEGIGRRRNRLCRPFALRHGALLEGFSPPCCRSDSVAGHDPMSQCQVSAGSSKILAKVGQALSAAGISNSSFGRGRGNMLGAGPAGSKFTLLVENPESFETPDRARTGGTA